MMTSHCGPHGRFQWTVIWDRLQSVSQHQHFLSLQLFLFKFSLLMLSFHSISVLSPSPSTYYNAYNNNGSIVVIYTFRVVVISILQCCLTLAESILTQRTMMINIMEWQACLNSTHLPTCAPKGRQLKWHCCRIVGHFNVRLLLRTNANVVRSCF